jgi:glycosyltransferase involved in cell wall biosynthesis
MALGITSIATNVNALPEAVKHLETGWLIEPGDAVALCDAFHAMAGDKELRTRLGEAGRRFVLENFNQKVTSRLVI